MNTMTKKVIRIDQSIEADEVEESADFAAALTPAEREEARTLAQGVVAAAVKGALHRIDPQRYPLADAADVLEAQVSTAMAALPVKAAQRIGPRVMAIGDGTRVPALLKGIDPDAFRKARHTIKPIERGRLLRPVARVSGGSAPAPAKYTRAILELRAIHCVRETGGGGADEIVFGGVLVGASGNTNAIDAFDAGDFDSGTYAEFGAKPIGRYSLKTIEGYPSHLYAIFMLVESDSDDQDVANALTSTITVIAVAAAAYFSGGLAAGAAYAVFEAIGGLIDSFFGPDALRHYGIRLTLDSNDPFGKPVGPKMRTGNITGDGAIYRVGYRWVLSA